MVVTISAVLSSIAFSLYSNLPVGTRPYHVPTQAEMNQLETQRVLACAITRRNLAWMREHPGRDLPPFLQPAHSIRRQRIAAMLDMSRRGDNLRCSFCEKS